MKGGYYVSYEKMVAEKSAVEQKIMLLEEELCEYPEGELQCVNNGSYTKWFHKLGKEKKYLPKEQKLLAQQLATKKYLSLQLNDLIQQKQAIDLYLKHRESHPDKADALLTNNSEYRTLISNLSDDFEKEITDWKNSPYEQNESYPQQKIYKTVTGQYVRSKSEVFISTVLHKYAIPFRYECALTLGNKVIYPDFTIRHPKTGKIYYYEHFGRMDDASYCKKACAKLELYSLNGIVPTIQLLATFETSDNPLTPEAVERLVKQYFIEE